MDSSEAQMKVNMLIIDKVFKHNHKKTDTNINITMTIIAEIYRELLDLIPNYDYQYTLKNINNVIYIKESELFRGEKYLFIEDIYYDLYIKRADHKLEYKDETYYSFDYLSIMSTLQIALKNKKREPEKVKSTYLMMDSKGYTKIGKANNPQIREKTLQSENPTIELIAICKEDVEKELHLKYKEYRVRGEWFKLNDKQIKYIIKKYKFGTIQKKIL